MEENNNEQEGAKELSRQEKNELKREERRKSEEKTIRSRKIQKSIPWVIFIGVVVGGVYWVAISAEKSTSERPGEAIPIVSRDHISVGDVHDGYNSNPPTSGAHAGPAPWGFSEIELPDENLIHNLEHGGIWVSYKDLDEESIDKLREIARTNSLSVVVSPREANDTQVAIASWGRLLKTDKVDVKVILDFIQKNKNKSPEPLAR